MAAGPTVHKLPPSVRFAGCRWLIVFKRMKDKLGLWDPTHTKVTLSPDQSRESLRKSLAHELTHGISDTLDLKLTEKQVEGVAVGWVGLLRDNPGLVRVLTD